MTLPRSMEMVYVAVLAFGLGGCFNAVRTTRRLPPAAVRPEELGDPNRRITGVVTADGRTVVFDSLAERQATDSLSACLNGAPLQIARRSIARFLIARAGEEPTSVAPVRLGHAMASPIVGVTTRSGERVSFDRDGGSFVTSGTVYARVAGQRYRLPLEDAGQIWVRRTNVPVTVLVTAVGTVALIEVLVHLQPTVAGNR